jgi:tRNA threonylcarbamoyladenosine biosynthesis protein TsaB
MSVLAIETATSRLSVALLAHDRVVARFDEDAPGKHAKLLLPTVDRLLQSGGVTLPDLDGLAVSIGPGSFTGLRVGLATVMGFRAVTGVPLVTVPTLEGLAWNLRGQEGAVYPILKSRTGEVYWACYRWNGLQLRQVQAEQVGTLEGAARAIEGPCTVLGEGWQANREELRRLLGARVRQVTEAPAEAHAASAVSVGLAGQVRLAQGERAATGLAPLYVQRAEAEIRWEARSGR